MEKTKTEQRVNELITKLSALTRTAAKGLSDPIQPFVAIDLDKVSEPVPPSKLSEKLLRIGYDLEYQNELPEKFTPIDFRVDVAATIACVNEIKATQDELWELQSVLFEELKDA